MTAEATLAHLDNYTVDEASPGHRSITQRYKMSWESVHVCPTDTTGPAPSGIYQPTWGPIFCYVYFTIPPPQIYLSLFILKLQCLKFKLQMVGVLIQK